MRVILDANVAIAAVASRGLCEAVLEVCLEQHQLILCDGILAEVEEKLRDKLRVPPPIIAEFLNVLRGNAAVLEPEAVAKGTCQDPNDLMILGLIGPGKADAIVTGDKDLLVVKRYKSTRIMSPRRFWEWNKEQQ